MKLRSAGSWVVYRVTIKGRSDGPTAVCELAEWTAMEAARPGLHTLLRGNIRNEAEAELLARGTAGDSRPRSADRLRDGISLGTRPAIPPTVG